MNKPIAITVGGSGPYDPAVGAHDMLIPIIAGQDAYVFKTGYGPQAYSSYSTLSGGGFHFTDPLANGEVFYIYTFGEAYGSDATDYTNGFNRSRVLASLFGRVGWQASSIPGAPVLTSSNTLSKGGRYFNDGSFHSIVQLKNLKETADIDPAADDPTFNAYLESLQRGVIMRCLNGVFAPQEFIRQDLLYTRILNNDIALANGNLFCGVRIRPPATPDIAVQIDSIALYFTQDVTFNLYLFNDVKKAPIWSMQVSAVAHEQTIVNLPDIILNWIGSSNLNGIFYLGYFQADLGTAQAIQEMDVCFIDQVPYSYKYFQSPKIAGVDFDRRNVANNFTTNTYGINLHVSVFKDHTERIVRKPALFDNLIGLQMAAQAIEQVIFANRSNSTERTNKDIVTIGNMVAELNGVYPISDVPQTTGLKKQITQEISRLRDSFFPRPKASSYALCSS